MFAYGRVALFHFSQNQFCGRDKRADNSKGPSEKDGCTSVVVSEWVAMRLTRSTLLLLRLVAPARICALGYWIFFARLGQ